MVKTDEGGSRKGLDILIPIALLRMYSSRKKSSERASPAFPASVTARRKNTTTTKEDGVTHFIENVEQLFSTCACEAIVAAWLRCILESSTSTGTSRQVDTLLNGWRLLTSDVSTSTKGFTACTFDYHNSSFLVIFPFLKENNKKFERTHDPN